MFANLTGTPTINSLELENKWNYVVWILVIVQNKYVIRHCSQDTPAVLLESTISGARLQWNCIYTMAILKLQKCFCTEKSRNVSPIDGWLVEFCKLVQDRVLDKMRPNWWNLSTSIYYEKTVKTHMLAISSQIRRFIFINLTFKH